MSHDAETLREDVVIKDAHGAHDMVLLTKYEANSKADGSKDENDPFMRMDLANAKWMMEVLQRHYPGHLWSTKYDGHHKMAYLSIPFLMGINKYWAVNLVQDQLTEGLLMRAGGELLERYGLKRSRFELTPFLEARDKHSALVNRKRVVPS
jgi:hypothetical protein